MHANKVLYPKNQFPDDIGDGDSNEGGSKAVDA
jgi:hypothetical protein